ncbi:hypothetical protein BVRB_7g165430 [Beta vulgaris subsp. vulgaris]|nr:hypothetical protein BVRB_7g165430 [Beta vulgaris subsp. vulgaris]
MKVVINTCIHLYGLANNDVPAAVNVLNAKACEDAKNVVLAAMADEEGCQKAINKNSSAGWQLLSSRNTMHDLSQLSNDLIGLLKVIVVGKWRQ